MERETIIVDGKSVDCLVQYRGHEFTIYAYVKQYCSLSSLDDYSLIVKTNYGELLIKPNTTEFKVVVDFMFRKENQEVNQEKLENDFYQLLNILKDEQEWNV